MYSESCRVWICIIVQRSPSFYLYLTVKPRLCCSFPFTHTCSYTRVWIQECVNVSFVNTARILSSQKSSKLAWQRCTVASNLRVCCVCSISAFSMLYFFPADVTQFFPPGSLKFDFISSDTVYFHGSEIKARIRSYRKRNRCCIQRVQILPDCVELLRSDFQDATEIHQQPCSSFWHRHILGHCRPGNCLHHQAGLYFKCLAAGSVASVHPEWPEEQNGWQKLSCKTNPRNHKCQPSYIYCCL